MTSGGLGVMGYGFPAAMGVQVAKPDAIVIDIAGDGSIQMNIQELITVVENNLPVKIAILNNSYLGMVRQWQQLFYDRRYSSTPMTAPDFVKLAEAYGAVGLRATKPEEVVPVIQEALKTPQAGDHGLQSGTRRVRHAHGARRQGHARDVTGLGGEMDRRWSRDIPYAVCGG